MPVEQGTGSPVSDPISDALEQVGEAVGGAVQQAARGRPPRRRPELPQVQSAAENLADAVMTAADRTRDIFRDISQTAVYHAPDTTFWTAAVQGDPALTYWTNDATLHFARIYGGDDLAAFLSTDLFTDPVSAERTRAALATLRDKSELVPGSLQYAAARAGVDPDALLERALNDPQAFAAMSTNEQAAVAGIANELLGALEELPDTGLTGELQRAIAIGSTGDLSIALSAEQQELLTQIQSEFDELGGLRQTGETLPLADIGIEQVRQLGNGVVVFDQEWARARPDEAYAAKIWLEQHMPEVEIEFGRQGIVGSVLDKLGVGTDYLTAPIAATMLQIDELVEQWTTTPEGRQQMLQRADDLERQLQSGEIPEERVDRTLAAIHQLRDEGVVEVGLQQFTDDMFRNANPRHIAMGFAESAMRAMELHPADPGYGAAFAAFGLVSNIAVDAPTLGLAVLGGARAARTIPKVSRLMPPVEDIAAGLRRVNPDLTPARARLAAERAVRYGEVPEVAQGWLRQRIYAALAKTPEEYAVTNPAMRAQQALWRMKRELGERDMGSLLRIFFRDNPRLGGDTEIARFISQTVSEEDMGLTITRAMAGMHAEIPNVGRLQARLNDALTQLDRENELTRLLATTADESLATELRILKNQHPDLVGQAAYLRSALEGADWVRPMRQVFTSRQIRKLERLTNRALDRPTGLMQSATEVSEVVPYQALQEGGATLQRVIDASPRVEQATRTMWQRWNDLWRNPGFGELLVFPHTSPEARALRAGAMGTVDDVSRRLMLNNSELGATAARQAAREIIAETRLGVDAADHSFDSIVAMGRRLGLTEDRIRDLMQPWVAGELTSEVRSFNWWRNTWEAMIGESPRLAAASKAELSRMWPSLVNDRAPGLIRVEMPGGGFRYESTLARSEINAMTGEAVPHPIPAFEADMFQTWRAPGQRAMTAHISRLQRTMREWRNVGGWGKKAASVSHLGLTQLWGGWNAFWRTTTLGFRFPGALPGRILGEEMVRIPAAADYASAVWHPVEWFRSTRLGTRAFPNTDLALMGDSPTHALGVVVDAYEANPSLRLARMAREEVTIDDGAAFFRSYSDILGRRYASPSTNRWLLPYLDDPETAVQAMRNGRYSEYARDILRHYTDNGMDAVEAVRRTQEELRQLIGTGSGSELIRVALRRQAVKIDGAVVRAGTEDFAEALERLAARGDWVPGTSRLPRSAGDYLPRERVAAFSIIRDKAFRMFYTAPDLALARSPLWRQMAGREYRNLVRRGYSPENALNVARAYSARGVSDVMFSIGAKTPGEWFLRNINPFFPAFRELGATWLYRVPLRMGEGIWPFGAAALARRGDIWYQFFENLGFIQTDVQGKPYIPLPGLDSAVRLLTGADIDFDEKAPLESLAGILPVPTGLLERDERGDPLPWHKRVQGLLPTLGGPSTFLLGMLNDLSGGKLTDAEDWLTLYGTDASLGPLAVDRFFEAFGVTMPWMTNTTQAHHEAVRTWAMIDGMRIAWDEMPTPPTEQDWDSDGDGELSPEEQAEFRAALVPWAEEWIDKGNRYAMSTYLLRGFAGMLLPFSVQIEDEGKQTMEAMWAFINATETQPGSGEFASALISSVLAENPNLGPYLTGKNQDTRRVDDPTHTLEEFMDAVRSGEIEVRSAQDWVVFALGMNSYSVYQSRVDAIHEEAGDNPAEWLLNFDAKETAEAERQAWEDFKDVTGIVDNFLPGQTQSFRDMLNTYDGYRRLRDGDQPRLSLQQQQLLDFDRAQREFSKYFSPNPESSDEYFRLKDEAYSALGNIGRGPVAEGTNWWFNEVQSPYYDRLDKLYNRLDRTEPRDRSLVYQEIRELSAEYAESRTHPDHPEWGDFPTPEEYQFRKMDPQTRQLQLAEWANLPATFLTEFQREQVGYTIPENRQDEADKLAALVTRGDHRFNRFVVQNDLSYASNSVKDAREQLTNLYGERAREMGLGAYWRELNQPEHQRIGEALGLGERSASWNWIARQVDVGREFIEAQGFAPGGTSDLAEAIRTWTVNKVRTLRRDDQAFDAILSQLAVALGDDGQPLADEELVEKLFFGVFNTSQSFYLDQ